MQTSSILLLILGVGKEDEILYFVFLPTAAQHWAQQWNKVLFTFSFKLTIELCYLLPLPFLTLFFNVSYNHWQYLYCDWVVLVSLPSMLFPALFFEFTAPQSLHDSFVWSTGVNRENKDPQIDLIAERSNQLSSSLFDKFSSITEIG